MWNLHHWIRQWNTESLLATRQCMSGTSILIMLCCIYVPAMSQHEDSLRAEGRALLGSVDDTAELMDLHAVVDIQKAVLEIIALVKESQHAEAEMRFNQIGCPRGRLAGSLWKLLRLPLFGYVHGTRYAYKDASLWGEMLQDGVGWIRVDVTQARQLLQVAEGVDVVVAVEGEGRVRQEMVVKGGMRSMDIPYWAGNAEMEISADGHPKALQASVVLTGWSNVPVEAHLYATDADRTVGINYNTRTRVFELERPSEICKDSNLMLWILPVDSDEVVFSRIVAHGISHVSLNEVNRQSGPLIPTIINPRTQRYVVMAFMVDEHGMQKSEVAKVVIGPPDANEK